jgi:hypothetical protein
VSMSSSPSTAKKKKKKKRITWKSGFSKKVW